MLNMFIPLPNNLLTSMTLSKSPMSHNRDQTTYLIKLKIFEAISKEASMSELYLFCLKSEKLY